MFIDNTVHFILLDYELSEEYFTMINLYYFFYVL